MEYVVARNIFVIRPPVLSGKMRRVCAIGEIGFGEVVTVCEEYCLNNFGQGLVVEYFV